MPNWCSGSLKLRGQYENQVKFFTEGLNEYNYEWNFDEKQQSVEIVVPKDKWIHRIEEYGEAGAREFVMEIEPGEWVYVEGTKRAFITPGYIDIAENESIVAVEINQAWDFRADDWINISKKYGLDIKLWGVDHGGGFMHEIEIVKGEIVSDISKHWDNYNDFLWECPLPWLGG